MRGELRVFTRSHKPIGVVYPAADIAVSWARNELGALTFRIPKRSVRWSTTYMRHLNRIEYHHPQLPVVWVGYIIGHDPQDVDVQITCVSAEWIYSRRFTEYEQEAAPYIDSLTTAQWIQYVHEQAARADFLGIRIGDLQHGGDLHTLEFQLANCGEALKALAELEHGDIWVEKRGHAHSDLWVLRHSRQRGRDLRGQVLLCSEVLASPTYSTSVSDTITHLHVLGHEEGPLRTYVQRTAGTQKRIFGRLEGKVENQLTADDAGIFAQQELSRSARVQGVPGLSIDNRRGQFGKFWIGDIVRAMVPGVGYAGLDAAVSVEGIQFNEASMVMGLVVREI